MSGSPDSGKTAYLRSLLNEEGSAGCLAPKAFYEDHFLGYDMELYPHGGRSVLVRERRTGSSFEKVIHRVKEESGGDYIFFGPFLFYNGVFRKSRQFLQQKLEDNSFRKWVLDEIGPLEMAGEGLAPLLSSMVKEFARSDRELYLSVRPDLVEPVQERFGFTADRTVKLNY